MINSDLIVNIILGILDVIILYYVYCGLTNTNHDFSIKNVLLGLTLGCLMGSSNDFIGQEFSRIVFYLIFILIIHLIYKKKMYNALIVFVVMYILVAIIQSAIWLILLSLSIQNEIVFYLSAQILSLFVIMYLCHKIPIHKLLYVIEKELILTLFFLILNCFMYGIFFYINFKFTEPYYIMYLAIIFISMVGIYKTVSKIYFYTNKLPFLKHDIENALGGIYICVNYSNDLDDLKDSINECFKALDLGIDSPIIATKEKDKKFHLFIQLKDQMKSKWKKLLYDIDIKYCEPHFKVSEPTMMIMLGILLDNAIEESMNGDKIKIYIYVTRQSLMIEVANAYNERFFDDYIKFMNSRKVKKQEEKGHGYGLLKLRKMAARYGGNVIMKEDYDEKDEKNYIVMTVEI